MMPIEHFLTDIMQISFTDWIENSIADIGVEIAVTDIFQPTLRNFFNKRWPTIYVFTVEGGFLFVVAVKI